MRFQEWHDKAKTLYADDGIAFSSYHAPFSRWPRTEEDIQRQEMAEAWAEVNEIAPGLPRETVHGIDMADIKILENYLGRSLWQE